MKRLVLFYVLSLLVFSSTWAEKHPFDNGLYWELNNGVLTISGNGGSTNWHSRPWESSKAEIKKVIIQNGVRTIGKWAFDECSNLSTVTIPQSVTSIGDNAFSGCISLSTIIIPQSVSSIGSDAFFDCGLTSISIPNSVKSIGNGAFSFCKRLSSISLPNTFCSIERDAFLQEDEDEIDKYYSGTIISMPQWLLDKGEDAWTYCGLSESSVNEFKRNNTPGNIIKRKGGYSSAVEMMNGSTKYYKVTKNGKYGLTSAEGEVIVPTEMETIEQAGTGFLRFKVGSYWGVMNYTGKIIIPTDRGYTKIGDYVSFTKRFPYEMDGYRGECNNLGVQVSKIKVATPQQNVATTNTTSNTSKNSTSSSGTTQTVVVEHRRDPVPMQVWVQCTGCFGSGMCQSGCGGTGWFTGWSGNSTRCVGCGGSGKCQFCAGQGGHYDVQYK